MGWEDRPYYRESAGRFTNPLAFIWSGSVPLFTFSGIRVRAHMTLVLFIAITLLIGGLGTKHYDLQQRVLSMTVLFIIVLLHEFGHAFASRAVGGEPDQILMHPLGGLAFANQPHRPGANLITVLGGPAVNVLLCLVTGSLYYQIEHHLPAFGHLPSGISTVTPYLYWIFWINAVLIGFNALPIYPLDGGQAFQSLLWFKLDYTRATIIACTVGIVGGILLTLFGLLTGQLLVIAIAVSCIFMSYHRRMLAREMGAEFGDGAGFDFSASLRPDKIKKRKKASHWQIHRMRRDAQRDIAEQQRIDLILAKVSTQGMHRLTWAERRVLKRATERQRRREMEAYNDR